jgi:hypothetical protein
VQVFTCVTEMTRECVVSAMSVCNDNGIASGVGGGGGGSADGGGGSACVYVSVQRCLCVWEGRGPNSWV